MRDLEHRHSLEEHIITKMEEGNLPSLNIAVFTPKETVFAESYGLRNLTTHEVADSQTVYAISSLTKVFTALAVLQLQDANKLQLDDPVTRYLPTFSIRDSAAQAVPPTIRQLLSHTAGLPLGPCSFIPFYLQVCDTDALLARLPDSHLVYLPGSRFKYSNLGYVVLGQVISHVTGMPYAEYVTEHLLKPMGMHQTGFNLEPRLRNQLAVGYQRETYRSLIKQGDYLVAAQAAPGVEAAANMLSTRDDLVRFATMLLREGHTKDRQVVSSQAFEAFQTPHTVIGNDPAVGYGLGIKITRRAGILCLEHGGGGSGYTSYLMTWPTYGVGAVALTNRCYAFYELYDLLTDAVQNVPSSPVKKKRPKRLWQKYEGTYGSNQETLHVTFAQGRLQGHYDDGAVILLTPRRKHTFVQQGGPYTEYLLRFVLHEGNCIGGYAGPAYFLRKGASTPACPSYPTLWHQLEGQYRLTGFGDAEVFVRRGKLIFAWSPFHEAELEPLSDYVFRNKTGLFVGETIRFHLSASNLDMTLEAASLSFQRVAPSQANRLALTT